MDEGGGDVRGKTYGHHGTTARSRDEDLRGIGLVLRERPLDHVGNGVGVSATVVAKCRLATHIPTGTGVRRRGVDNDETILFGKLAVRATGIVGLSRASAEVDGDNDTGASGKLLGYINVEAGLGGGSTEGGDLGKGARSYGTLAERCR
jgi:hypothetical protein